MKRKNIRIFFIITLFAIFIVTSQISSIGVNWDNVTEYDPNANSSATKKDDFTYDPTATYKVSGGGTQIVITQNGSTLTLPNLNAGSSFGGFEGADGTGLGFGQSYDEDGDGQYDYEVYTAEDFLETVANDPNQSERSKKFSK